MFVLTRNLLQLLTDGSIFASDLIPDYLRCLLFLEGFTAGICSVHWDAQTAHLLVLLNSSQELRWGQVRQSIGMVCRGSIMHVLRQFRLQLASFDSQASFFTSVAPFVHNTTSSQVLTAFSLPGLVESLLGPVVFRQVFVGPSA